MKCFCGACICIRVSPAAATSRLFNTRTLPPRRVSTVIHCFSRLSKEAPSWLGLLAVCLFPFDFWLLAASPTGSYAQKEKSTCCRETNLGSNKYSVQSKKRPPGSPKSHQSRSRTARFFFPFTAHLLTAASPSLDANQPQPKHNPQTRCCCCCFVFVFSFASPCKPS